MDKIQSASPQWQTQAAAPQKAADKQASTSTPDLMRSLPDNETFSADRFSQPLLGQGLAEQSLSLGLDVKMSPEQIARLRSNDDIINNKVIQPTHGSFAARAVADDKLGFFNPNLPTDKAIFELQMPRPRPENLSGSNGRPGNDDQQSPKIRSPYLQEMLRHAGNDFIKDPLATAWKDKDLSLDSLKAAGMAGALLAGAVLAPTDIKSSTSLFKSSFSDYEVSAKAGITSGHGEVGFRSIGFSVKPQQEYGNQRSSLDVKYDMEDKEVGISYSKSIHYSGSGSDSSNSYFNAGISHSSKNEGTKANISYYLRF